MAIDLKSLEPLLASLVQATLHKMASRTSVLTAIVSQMPKADVAGMDPAQWLLWFLRNHHNGPLIEAGHWKRHDWLVADVGSECAAVLMAAFMTGGQGAAWPILVERLDGAHGQQAVKGVTRMTVARSDDRREWQLHIYGKRVRDE